MSREQAITGDRMRDVISPAAREDWAVHQAAHDVKVLAIFELFELYDINEATMDLVRLDLRDMVAEDYGIPPERSDEVFEKAEAIIWQEMEDDGEA